MQDDLRAMLEGFPGVNFAIRGFLAERIEETLTGSTAQVVVKLFGDDLDSLDLSARRMAKTMAGCRARPTSSTTAAGRAGGHGAASAPDVARVGLRPDEVLEAVETATRGATVAQVVRRQPHHRCRGDPRLPRRAPSRASSPLPLATVDGRIVALQSVADVERTTGRSLIMHVGHPPGGDGDGQRRRARRRGFARGGSRPGSRGRPASQPASSPSTAEPRRRSGARSGSCCSTALLAGAGILMLLWLAFGERGRLSLVLLNLPFALVGGVLAVFATGACCHLARWSGSSRSSASPPATPSCSSRTTTTW